MVRVGSLTIGFLCGCVMLPLALALLVDDALAKPRDLTGAQIRKTITGATIHMHTPLGTVVPVTYAEDGSLRGKAGSVAFFLGAARDRGKWWVKGRELCQKWSVWFRGKTRCIRVKRVGRKFYWRDGDGESGTATIVSQPQRKQRVAKPAQRKAPVQRRRVAKAKVQPRPGPDAFSGRRRVGPKPAPPSRTIRVPKPRIASRPTRSPSPAQPETNPETAALADRRTPQVSPEPFRKTHQRRFRVVGVRTNDVLNMRARPNPDSDVLVGIPALARGLDLIGPCVGEWCRIRYANRLGWAHSAYMELEDPPAARRSGGDYSGFRVVGVRPDDRLNVRVAPSSESRIVATIPPFGRGIRIIGACADVWCPVAYRQANGWVNSLFIEREGSQASSRIR